MLIYFCPESPRWLYSKGKDDEALQVLAYYHADGNQYVLQTSVFDAFRLIITVATTP